MAPNSLGLEIQASEEPSWPDEPTEDHGGWGTGGDESGWGVGPADESSWGEPHNNEWPPEEPDTWPPPDPPLEIKPTARPAADEAEYLWGEDSNTPDATNRRGGGRGRGGRGRGITGYVNPDRVKTGGQRDKMTPDELAERMAKIKLQNEKIKQKREMVEADKAAFQTETAAEKKSRDYSRKIQQELINSREENARRKMAKVGVREWDAEKKEDGSHLEETRPLVDTDSAPDPNGNDWMKERERPAQFGWNKGGRERDYSDGAGAFGKSHSGENGWEQRSPGSANNSESGRGRGRGRGGGRGRGEGRGRGRGGGRGRDSDGGSQRRNSSGAKSPSNSNSGWGTGPADGEETKVHEQHNFGDEPDDAVAELNKW